MESTGIFALAEEFHQQIKQDFSLEKFRYQRNTLIRNKSALLLIAMSFVAKFKDEQLDYLLAFTRLTIPKHKPISYYFYLIVKGLRIIFFTIEKI